MICGPIRDKKASEWRRKFNNELQEELGIASIH